MSRIILASWIALTTLASAMAFTPQAAAHGEGVEMFRGREGPYDIVVEVQPETPVVGTVHFGVGVIETSTLSPVEDLKVVIVAIDEAGNPVYQSPALIGPDGPAIYDANILFRSPGLWTISVELASERLGDATVHFPLVVRQEAGGTSLAGPLVLAALVVVLTGGATYVWYSARRKQWARGNTRRASR